MTRRPPPSQTMPRTPDRFRHPHHSQTCQLARAAATAAAAAALVAVPIWIASRVEPSIQAGAGRRSAKSTRPPQPPYAPTASSPDPASPPAAHRVQHPASTPRPTRTPQTPQTPHGPTVLASPPTSHPRTTSTRLPTPSPPPPLPLPCPIAQHRLSPLPRHKTFPPRHPRRHNPWCISSHNPPPPPRRLPRLDAATRPARRAAKS